MTNTGFPFNRKEKDLGAARGIKGWGVPEKGPEKGAQQPLGNNPIIKRAYGARAIDAERTARLSLPVIVSYSQMRSLLAQGPSRTFITGLCR